MEVAQAEGSVNVNSVDEIKMAENLAMTVPLEKTEHLGLDSRGRRRKSKYLSYPYTNIGSRQKGSLAETEEPSTPCLSLKEEASSRKATKRLSGSPLLAKLGSKRFQRNWYRKFISCNAMSSSPEFLNASSAEFLSRLYSKAVDCMFPIENKNFDLVEWFFCRFRVSEYNDEAELANSLVNAEGGIIVKPVGNDLPGNKTEEKKRKNNKTETGAKPKMKSLSGLSDVNLSISAGNPMRSGRKLKQKRKVDEVTSLNQVQNAETTLDESSGKHGSLPEAIQNLSCTASEKKAGPKRRKNTEAAREHQSTQTVSAFVATNSTKCSSLVIDLQPTSLPVYGGVPEKSNDESKEEPILLGLTSNLKSSVSQGPVGNVSNHSFMVSTTASDCSAVSLNEPGQNRMVKAVEHLNLNNTLAMEIPDLNGTCFESNSVRIDFENVSILSPEAKTEQPRILSSCTRPTRAVNFSRLEHNGETHGTCLILRFAPGAPIPPKEDLMATFCRFGPLKPTETQLLKDISSAQIAFVRSADAGEAFCSLEQNKPFGDTVAEYKLYNPSAATQQAKRFGTPTQPAGVVPLLVEAPPPLDFIKQNLQMMTSILENSGNNLSPQMRAKLESEIKNLMKKVNSRACSSELKSE